MEKLAEQLAGIGQFGGAVRQQMGVSAILCDCIFAIDGRFQADSLSR
jgi:hypothetical protein